MASDTTVRVALLGCDRELLRLVRALGRQTRLRVMAGYCVGRYEAALRALVPGIALHDHWEPLLAEAGDGVTLVARDQQEPWRGDALRRLTRAGRVLWLAHPACSYLLAIELDVVQRGHGGALVPFCPALAAPALRRFQELIAAWCAPDDQPSGVELELTTPVFARKPHESTALRARDVSLLQYVVGPLTRVSAAELGGDGDASAWSATIDTERGMRVQWSAADAQQQAYTQLRARCDQRSARLQVTHDAQWWSLTTTPESDVGLEPDAAEWDGPAHGIAALCTILDGSDADRGRPISWSQMCDDLEVLEAVARSRRDGRSVMLRERARRPERAFQQRMALGGCLLMLMCLALLMGGAVREVFMLPRGNVTAAVSGPQQDPAAAQARDAASDEAYPIWLRLWPAYPLIVFLLYQLWRAKILNDS